MHQVEKMFSINTPWHELGTRIPAHVDLEQALVLGGMDFDVVTRELVALPSFPQSALDADGFARQEVVNEVPMSHCLRMTKTLGRVATVRVNKDGTEQVLGNVGSKYSVVQNRRLGEFCLALANTGGAVFETGGTLFRGQQVWFLMALDKVDVKVAGVSPVKVFLFCRNSHDGSTMVDATVTPVEVVCWNTANMAIEGAERIVSIRHTGDPMSRATEAAQALEIAVDYSKQFQALADSLTAVPFDLGDMKKVTEAMYPEDEKGNLSGQSRNAREELRWLFGKVGDRTPEYENTAWAAYAAVTERNAHRKSKASSDSRVKSILEGSRRDMQQIALTEIANLKQLDIPIVEMARVPRKNANRIEMHAKAMPLPQV